MTSRRELRCAFAIASIGLSFVALAAAGLPRATTVLLSASSRGVGSGDGASFHARVSADGGTVAFDSEATDLVGGLAVAPGNVFAFDLATAVAFQSDASDLVPDDGNATTDVFARRLE